MVRNFLRWWQAQLARLWHVSAGALPRSTLVLATGDTEDPALTLTSERRGVAKVLGRFTPDAAGDQALRRVLRAAGGKPLVLRLPPGAVLERPVTLPLAAEREVAAALQHDLDRLTPFRAADVVWAADIIGRDRRHGLLHLRLLLVPRAKVAAILAVAATAGTTVAIVQDRGADGSKRQIALDPERRPAWHDYLVRVPLFACMTLAAALIVAPFLHQANLLEAADARIAIAQPLAREAGEIRRRLAEEAASGDVIATTQRELGSPLGILSALTEVLPDDTFLLGLTLRQRQLVLRGQSANAARLIALLAGSGAISGPSFAAPVTRGTGDSQDQFSIVAAVGP